MDSLREANSSPIPKFTAEQLRTYYSVENLIKEQELQEQEQLDILIKTPFTIIPPTPINQYNLVSSPFNELERSGSSTIIPYNNTYIIPPTPINEDNLLNQDGPNSLLSNISSNFEEGETSCLDSDNDPEYFPPVQAEGMVDLLRDDSLCSSKKLTTKRLRCPEKWKMNVRKVKCQAGEEFVDHLGITHKKREIKVGCAVSCPYSCNELFSLAERQKLFGNFWKLNAKSKGEFFGKMVFRLSVERKRTENTNSRRKHTYNYHFLKYGKLTRVCQLFFVKTLDINKTRIHYYFDNLIDEKTNTTKSPAKGKHYKNKLPENKLDEVATHINEFATVDSHYCRASSNKKYLQPNLNLKKMYELYCNEFDDPVKFWVYKDIFETRFNLSFFVPKKDLCNKCEEHNTKQKNGIVLTPEEHKHFADHLQNKLNAKAEKDSDKANSETNTRIVVIDLQNVFALPKANVNCFYYKRKLLCFNLTGYCKDNRTTYCSIWNETTQGRGANELASAFKRILDAVILDFPETAKIIIWTDSCVPQNRNSILSLCLIKFLKDNPTVKSIEQKYSEPGHSLLQEVDAVHSTLERYLKNMEIYSPIGLIRLLSNAKFPKVTLKVLQMKNTDFWNYSQAAQKFSFTNIPYTKIRHLRYEIRSALEVSYKRAFNDQFDTESITKPISSRKTRKLHVEEASLQNFEIELCQKETFRISDEKRKDLISLLKFMPKQDQLFYNAALRIEHN